MLGLVADYRAVVVALATATAPCPAVESTLTRERLRRPEGGAAVAAFAGRTEEVDPGVLAAAQHGDDGAFVDIMRHYDRRLRIVAFHVLNDRQLMDDVLQDVTLRVYRSLARFRGESSLGTWLCRITYRACCDAIDTRRSAAPAPAGRAARSSGPRAGPRRRPGDTDRPGGGLCRPPARAAPRGAAGRPRGLRLHDDRGDPRRADGHAGLAPERGPGDPAPLPEVVDEPRGGVMDETRDTRAGPAAGSPGRARSRARVLAGRAAAGRGGLGGGARRPRPRPPAARRLRPPSGASGAGGGRARRGDSRRPARWPPAHCRVPQTVSAAQVLDRALAAYSSGHTWQADLVGKFFGARCGRPHTLTSSAGST